MTPTPHLIALATTVPPHRFDQPAVAEAAQEIFADRVQEFRRLRGVFATAGVGTRYSSVPLDWYKAPHGWRDRNGAYLDSATDCLERAARTCLERAGLGVEDVDGLVVVSSTGIATPGLDAVLIDRMGFRPDTMRLPVFGLGCAGGVVGLGRAADVARSNPGRNILFLVVELCALWFRDTPDKANIVATALFGEGAAGLLLRAEEDGAPGPARHPALRAWGEHTWPRSQDIMGWSIEEDGLGVIFSPTIPVLVRERLRPATDAFLERHGYALPQFDGLIAHPGGAKVLDAIEATMAPCTDGLDDSAAVLRDYGNMSAATVLFVLERRLQRGARGRHLMTALGPGFTAGFLVIDL
ncbi:MAG TPA: type III polyketide synthase [Azospirillaceae bacterium]|nr:type III polyketide synthase [Azospirillaceae bacterium]